MNPPLCRRAEHDPRPPNTYVWARWSELHRLIRALSKVYTPVNWLIADAPPRSIHAIALFLRSHACRADWPEVRILTAEERASSLAARAALANPVLSNRLANLARLIHETDHAVLLNRALPDAPQSLFPMLARCGETVRPQPFYQDLARALGEDWAARFISSWPTIDSAGLHEISVVRSLDPMFHEPIASSRMGVHLAEALNTILVYMRQTRSTSVDLIFMDALAHWRPKNHGGQVDSLLCWLPPPPVPWEGDDKLKPLRTPAALARASRKFSNCLKTHVLDQACGVLAFYEWEDTCDPAVVALQYQHTLGWTISSIRGPKNRFASSPTQYEIAARLKLAGVSSTLPMRDAINTLSRFHRSPALR